MGIDGSLFRPELVFFDIDATDWKDLMRQLGERLAPLGYTKPDWYQKITAREEKYPTGLQTKTVAIAIPHADDCVEREYIAVVRPVHPVTFKPMANIGNPVDAGLVLNLGVTRDGGQVAVLQALMNLFMNEEAVQKIMEQTTAEGMVQTISGYLQD